MPLILYGKMGREKWGVGRNFLQEGGSHGPQNQCLKEKGLNTPTLLRLSRLSTDMGTLTPVAIASHTFPPLFFIIKYSNKWPEDKKTQCGPFITYFIERKVSGERKRVKRLAIDTVNAHKLLRPHPYEKDTDRVGEKKLPWH